MVMWFYFILYLFSDVFLGTLEYDFTLRVYALMVLLVTVLATTITSLYIVIHLGVHA